MKQPRYHAAILLRIVGMGVSSALLAGCSVKSPPQIRSSAGTALSLSQITMIEPAAQQTQRLQMHTALARALEAKGVTISADAAAIGEVAIASSPSTVGLYAGEAGGSDEDARPIAETRKTHWYDSCEASRIKASLAVFDRSSGDLIKRSEAETTTCANDALPAEELARLLAADLTGN